jgi:hypothetical protein
MNISPLHILRNKERSIDRQHYTLTPDLDDFWQFDAIMEGRGRGVPHAVFFDTCDKVAIFPNDIPGFESLFDSGSYAWRDGDGWSRDATHENVEDAHAALVELRRCLRERGHKAELVCARGHSKGYFDGLDVDATADSLDFALWVYTESDDLEGLLRDQVPSGAA